MLLIQSPNTKVKSPYSQLSGNPSVCSNLSPTPVVFWPYGNHLKSRLIELDVCVCVAKTKNVWLRLLHWILQTCWQHPSVCPSVHPSIHSYTFIFHHTLLYVTHRSSQIDLIISLRHQQQKLVCSASSCRSNELQFMDHDIHPDRYSINHHRAVVSVFTKYSSQLTQPLSVERVGFVFNFCCYYFFCSLNF